MITCIDACPACQPGIPSAAPAIGPAQQVKGGTVTAHQCPSCATAWETFWVDDWPAERSVVLVSPASGRQEREALDAA